MISDQSTKELPGEYNLYANNSKYCFKFYLYISPVPKSADSTLIIRNAPPGWLVIYCPSIWECVSDITDELEICAVFNHGRKARAFVNKKKQRDDYRLIWGYDS